ncbi:MAG: esterase-like activity of phytase family protein [Massilia sp.]
MKTRCLLATLAIPLLLTPAADAAVRLIAVGTLSGNTVDRSTTTGGPLESGVAGNLFGGIGSGLAYAGGESFIAVPDRGPNANAYNSAIDNTTSYIPRFHTLKMTLAPSAPGANLPFTLTPSLLDTTLLSSPQPLFYGSGAGLGVGNGAPALNAQDRTWYFSGRSDNVDPARPSTDSMNARFDPEGVRVSNDGAYVYITDEYGPFVYQFNRQSGKRVRAFTLPIEFAVNYVSPQGAVEIANNRMGRIANKGMEGLAITPDGKTLVGIMQSPLAQDGGTDGRITRIVSIDIATGAVLQYAYPLTNIGSSSSPKYPTVSEIVAINNHEFLVDERDGKGLGDDSKAVHKQIYRIDLAGAAVVGGTSGEAALARYAVNKTLFLDVVQALASAGYAAKNMPAKLEGMAFGPDVVIDGVARRTLYISNDNDFIGTVTDSGHPAGIDNPNTFLVFAIDAQDLPGFVRQPVRAQLKAL